MEHGGLPAQHVQFQGGDVATSVSTEEVDARVTLLERLEPAGGDGKNPMLLACGGADELTIQELSPRQQPLEPRTPPGLTGLRCGQHERA